MRISEDKIIQSVSENNSNSQEFVILRMYDEYRKYGELKNLNLDDISMLEIKNSFDKIKNKIIGEKANEKILYNKKINDYIENVFLILKNAISNCDKKDKEKVLEIIKLITELECLLKISVSFPEALEQSLLNKLDNKKIKRYYKGK